MELRIDKFMRIHSETKRDELVKNVARTEE